MATLTVLEGTNAGREYEIPDVCFLGRSAQCDVRVGDLTVSRKHCRIQRYNGKYWVEDLGSGNGTYLNRQPIVREELHHSDEIKMGHSRFRFGDRSRQLPAIREVITSQTNLNPARLQLVTDNHTSIDQEIDASHDVLLPQAPLPTRAELERAYYRLRTVYAVFQAVSSILSIDKLLDEILKQLMHVFQQAERSAVLVLDESTQELTPYSVRYRDQGDDQGDDPLDNRELAPGVIEAVVKKRKAVLISERPPGDPDSEIPARQITMTGVHQGSTMCAPLVAGGEVLGILQISAGPAQIFHRDDLDLHAGIAVQAGVALANARMHDRLLKQNRMHEDLQVAEQIQRSFLPRVQPTVPGFSFHAHYDPAYEVGGDFYDFIQLPDGRLAILIGDVSGKGVPAALLMARMASELRVAALAEREPARVMARVNRALIEMGHSDMFVTAVYAVLDPLRRRLVWANAGHLPPYLRRAQGPGKVERLEEVVSLALGILLDARYDEDFVELEPNDSVVLFTDGVVEAKNKQGEEFGFDRLSSAIIHSAAAGDILGRVLDEVAQHVGGEPPYDDLTIVTIGYPGSTDSWHADLTRRVLPVK